MKTIDSINSKHKFFINYYLVLQLIGDNSLDTFLLFVNLDSTGFCHASEILHKLSCEYHA